LTTDTDTDITARATLALLEPARNPNLHNLITTYGPVDAYQWLTAADTRPDDRDQVVPGVTAETLTHYAATVTATAAAAHARILIPETGDWPARLDDQSRVALPAAPSSALCLWIRGHGQPADLLHRMVAVSGAPTHPSTDHAVTAAVNLGHDLTTAGWTVAAIAGRSSIDDAALHGALAAHGRPVAVLFAGIDQPHPAAQRDLLDQITDRGLLVTALLPGMAVTRHRQTAAGRLLAGATTGTVLVEASRYSDAAAVLGEPIRRGRVAMILDNPDLTSAGATEFRRQYSRRTRLVRGAADILSQLTRH
jgi:DNA processing protein